MTNYYNLFKKHPFGFVEIIKSSFLTLAYNRIYKVQRDIL